MMRSFTEADVLGWEIRDKDDYLRDHSIRMPSSRDITYAHVQCEQMDALDPHRAPHRVCAVLPWPQEED